MRIVCLFFIENQAKSLEPSNTEIFDARKGCPEPSVEDVSSNYERDRRTSRYARRSRIAVGREKGKGEIICIGREQAREHEDVGGKYCEGKFGRWSNIYGV